VDVCLPGPASPRRTTRLGYRVLRLDARLVRDQPRVAVARIRHWDLSSIDLIDSRSGAHLATLLPLDREKNADRRRRALPAHDQNTPDPDGASRRAGVAPLLQKLMAEYSATGLPPAYLPKDQAFDPTDPEDPES
jgi:hypothetical protein